MFQSFGKWTVDDDKPIEKYPKKLEDLNIRPDLKLIHEKMKNLKYDYAILKGHNSTATPHIFSLI